MATLEQLRDKAHKLPMQPGVYIMMDRFGDVIYVGKAKLLRNRVSSYFHGEHNAKTEAMIAKIENFDVIIANSEFEALVLENSLIKHHQPHYNILLRDDKGYPFVRVDLNSEYPRFTVASRTAEDGAKYFGPYGGRNMTKNAIDAICKALRLPTCSRKFPRDIGKERPCLNYHMGTCRGYCLKDARVSEYREAVAAAVMIFEGKTSELTARLKQEMEQAAAELRFEVAAEKRDKLKAIGLLETKQRVVAGSAMDTDAVGFYRGEAKCCYTVLHYYGGDLLDKDYEIVEPLLESDEEALSAILTQYYEKRGAWPRQILLPFALEDAPELERLFTEKAGRKVRLAAPQRGEKNALVKAAVLNAKEETERVTTREEKYNKTLKWLTDALQLPALPRRIEAYDISNTGASDIVASMTVFINGRPAKREYRRFTIKTLTGPDDYASMHEVISRRMARFNEADEKFNTLPDVMFIDGGENHAKAALSAVLESGHSLPVFGMVKDDRHRTRALVTTQGQEIGIAANPAAFAFVGTIQEETHRFAIEFHRKQHIRHTITSELEKIPHVGEKRRADLLKFFGSVKAIKGAEKEELIKVVPKNAADAIFEHFHGESGE